MRALIADYVPGTDDATPRIRVSLTNNEGQSVTCEAVTIGEAMAWAERLEGAAEQFERNQ